MNSARRCFNGDRILFSSSPNYMALLAVDKEGVGPSTFNVSKALIGEKLIEQA
jgi:hypothetical protein